MSVSDFFGEDLDDVLPVAQENLPEDKLWVNINPEYFPLLKRLYAEGKIDKKMYPIEKFETNKIRSTMEVSLVNKLIYDWSCDPYPVSDIIKNYLFEVTSGKELLNKIKVECFKIIEEQKIYGQVFISEDKLKIVANHKEGIKMIKDKLKNEINEISYEKDLNEDFIKEINCLKEKEKDKCHMEIENNKNNKNKVFIKIAGKHKDLELIKAHIDQMSKSFTIKSHSVSIGSSFNCFTHFYKDLQLGSINMESVKFEASTKLIHFNCLPGNLSHAEEAIRKLLSSYSTKTLHLTEAALSKELIDKHQVFESFSKNHKVLLGWPGSAEDANQSVGEDKRKSGKEGACESEDRGDEGEDGGEKGGQKTNSNALEIKVLRGNIVKETSDVLVNVLSGKQKEGNPTVLGALSRAFHDQAGPSMAQDLLREGVPTSFDKHIVETPSHGIVTASTIYHFYIKKVKDCYKLLQEVVLKCLKKAHAAGHKNIMVPTMGCGNLRMNERDVARAILQAYAAFKAEHGNAIKLSVCAFDNRLFTIFTKEFSPPATIKASTFKRKISDEHVSSSALVVSLRYFGDADVEEVLRKHLEEHLPLISLPHNVPVDCLQPLLGSLLQHHPGFELREDTVLVRASSKEKVGVEKEVRRLLAEEEARLQDRLYLKKKLGAGGYYKEMSKKDTKLQPDYWKGRPDVCDDLELDSNHPTYKAIKELIEKTTDVSLIGIGKDATGLSYSGHQIKQIFLVRNTKNWGFYKANLNEYSVRYCQETFKSLENVTNKEVATYEVLTTLNNNLEAELNERYLFHGTKAPLVKQIQHNGVDNRVGTSKLLFGKGCYFAESFTKADQYADKKDGREPNGTDLTVFLCRVALGKTFLSAGTYDFDMPPCIKCEKAGCLDCLDKFDSLVGTHKTEVNDDKTKLLFREFVVYQKTQSYPEYRIIYVRK